MYYPLDLIKETVDLILGDHFLVIGRIYNCII